MEKQKIYRLDKETFEITEVNPERALKIIGYYYRDPQKLLEDKSKVITTPYAYFSTNEKLLEDFKINKERV